MSDISVFKITFGEEIYNAILVKTKIKYFAQGKCLLLILLYLPFPDSAMSRCGQQNCLNLTRIIKKSCLDSFDTASAKKTTDINDQ